MERNLNPLMISMQTFLDVAGVIFVGLDTTGKVTMINRKGCEVLGWSETEILGKNWHSSFLPDEVQPEVKSVFKELMDGKIDPVEYYENPIKAKNGDEKVIAWHNAVLRDRAGRITGTLSSGEDITDRKKAEALIKISLTEKEVLLREIHHRVKNNLNVITSLLKLQVLKSDKDSEKITPLVESANRIQSMALVHDQLYNSKHVSKIYLRKYVDALSKEILTHFHNLKNINFAINIKEIELDVNTAIPCGLILNETFTHIFKSISKNTEDTDIVVMGKRNENEDIQIEVKHCGSVSSSTVTADDASTLGLELIDILVNQVGGTIQVHRNQCTIFHITIPKANYENIEDPYR